MKPMTSLGWGAYRNFVRAGRVASYVCFIVIVILVSDLHKNKYENVERHLSHVGLSLETRAT